MKRSLPLIGSLLLLGSILLVIPDLLAPDEDQARETVLKVLQTLPRSFVVLQTQHTIVVSHRDRSSWLLGTSRGQSVMTIRIHAGVDLAKVTRSHIRVDGRDVRIRLPDPEVFDVVPDLDSWRYTGKRSGLQVVGDTVRGSSLEQRLMHDIQRAMRGYRTRKPDVDRDAMIARLNRQADDLFEGTGLSVRFD